MRSIASAMTTAAALFFAAATLHAQTWQKPPDNQRSPLKWGDTAIRTPTKMEEGDEKIFAAIDRLMHRHGKY